MRSTPLLIVAATVVGTLGLTVAPSPAAEPEPAPTGGESLLTLAYYYPWYYQGDWSRHGYVGTPVLGKYGTDDPKTAEQHIEWAKQAGIDALVVSWWGPDHLCAEHTAKGLLQADNLDQIKFALIYESLGRLDEADGTPDAVAHFDHPDVAERFTADMKLLAETYFDHPSYLKLAGRPVVVLYVTRTFRHFTRDHIAAAEKAAGVDLYLIADDPFFGDQKDPATALHGLAPDGKPVFDAYTAYNMFENALVRDGETAWDYLKREGVPIFERWAKRTVFHPQVMPSYHDFRGHKPLAGGVEQFKAQIDALARLPRPADAPATPDNPRMLFVTSFNEWWEGTTIEPTEEYGTTYLDALREAVDAVRTTQKAE